MAKYKIEQQLRTKYQLHNIPKGISHLFSHVPLRENYQKNNHSEPYEISTAKNNDEQHFNYSQPI